MFLTPIQLKKLKTGFNFSGFELPQKTTKSAKKTKKTKASKAKKKVEPETMMKRHELKISSTINQKKAEAKKSQDYIKQITAKVNKIVEKFAKTNQLSNQLPKQERIRHKIREKLFFSLMFGLEELKLKKHLGETEEWNQFTDESGTLLNDTTKGQTDIVKSIALDIEANLYHRFNKDVSQTSEYSSKSRIVS